MRLHSIFTLIAVAIVAITSMAQQPALTLTSNESQHTITISVITDDIVKVEVAPTGWRGNALPSLLSEEALNHRPVRARQFHASPAAHRQRVVLRRR